MATIIEAEKLWESILDFAADSGNLFGEGNSGEFTDEKELDSCRKCFISSLDDLVLKFYEAVNFLPVFKNGKTVQENFKYSGPEFLLEFKNWKLE